MEFWRQGISPRDLVTAGSVRNAYRLAALMDLGRLCGSGSPWRQLLEAAGVTGAGEAATGPDAAFEPNIAVLRGTLAPGGAVIKRADADPRLLRHRGPARVFDGPADLFARVDDESLGLTEDSVLVLRGAGPAGGPGMPEVGQLPVPQYLQRRGVTDMLLETAS